MTDSVSQVATLLSLRNAVVALKGGAHVILQVPESEAYLIACFSTKERLKTTLARAGLEYDQIGNIDDARKFLNDLPKTLEGRPLKVIMDLTFTEQGVDYLEIVDTL